MKPLPASGARSELRTLRVLTGAVGVTALAATAASTLLIAQPARLSVTDWGGVLTLAAAALPLIAGAVAPWSGIRTLRLLNAGVTVLHAIMLVALLVATALGRADGGEVPWFFTITAAPVAAALIAWGRSAAWGVLGGITATIQSIRLLIGVDMQSALANDVQAFFMAATLVLLFSTLIRASRELDHSTEVSTAAEQQRSASAARSRIQDRLQVLVHDELLSTLVLAARDEPTLRPAVAAEAAQARRRIRELHGPEETTGLIPSDRLIAGITGVARQEAPDARFEVFDTRTDLEWRMPTEVGEALQGALRQALTNSRIHAGPQAHSSVEVQLDDDQLLIVVHDDGVGFAPLTVPPTRMGIASSIVGRLSALPGGDASVDSTPGGGTTVTLRWVRGPSPSPVAHEAASSGILPLEDHRIRRGLIVTIGVFLAAQACLAALAGFRAGEPWVATLALTGIGLGFFGIGWRSLGQPTQPRSWGVMLIVTVTAALSFVPVQRDPLRYGDTWYLAAVAFVLLALAIRGRPRIAAAGGAVVSVIALASVAIQHNDDVDVVAAVTRLVVILSIGVCLVFVIAHTQARSAEVRAEELKAVRASAYREAANRELRERSRALDELIGGLLERLERGEALSPVERRECTALEGRLRDQYRGGRLIRPPLIEAAMSARRRGLDVVLLDDGPDRELGDTDLDTIAAWMGEQLDAVVAGRFTGRIQPADRDPVASVVAGDEVVELRLTAQKQVH